MKKIRVTTFAAVAATGLAARAFAAVVSAAEALPITPQLDGPRADYPYDGAFDSTNRAGVAQRRRVKFSMSVKATSLVDGGEMADAVGRKWLIDWFRTNGFSKIYLESYRHNVYAPTRVLTAARDDFRTAGYEVCGLLTPTCLHLDPSVTPRAGQFVTCFGNPRARARLANEVARCAAVFDTILFDDFLFAACPEKCEYCRDASAAFRLELVNRVSREIVETARAVNPKCRLILKYPCWYGSWASKGLVPAEQSAIFDGCWVGNETRNAGREPFWAFLAYDHLDGMSGGRCGGVWFDPLDSTPEKFVEQAYYSILSGAPEVLVHCYDYMLSRHPGTTPFGEDFSKARECGRLFMERIGEIHRLAEFCGVAKRGEAKMQPNGVSLHYYTFSNRVYVARLNTTGATVDDSLGPLAPHDFEFPKPAERPEE